MRPEIASIHDRMAEGGDWRSFRDEIAALHAEAQTEEEYVTLLEAHRNLVAVAEYAYDADTYEKLIPIAEAEYLGFLNKESLEFGTINPIILDRVTQREVEAGRLDADDDFRKLAEAGAQILGDSAELQFHACRNGNYVFYAMATAAVLAWGLTAIGFSPLWLILLGFFAGWAIDEKERNRIKADIKRHRNDALR